MNNSMKITIAGVAVASAMSIPLNADAISNQQMEVVGTSSLIIRSMQDQQKTVEKISKGTVVTVIKEMKNQKGWYYVQTPSGKKGVCSGLYLRNIKNQTQSSSEQNIYYTKASLNLRKGAGTSYIVLKTIPKGQKVTKLGSVNGWAKVTCNGLTGYCSESYLQKNNIVQQNSSVSKETYDSNNTKYVNTSSLNVRTQPNTSSSIYKKITVGTEVNVIEQRNDGWSKIKMDGKDLYISSDYLSANRPNSTTSVEYKYSVQATTPTSKSSINSIKNVQTAFEKIDGTIVNPDETFYYLKAIGAITKENGFIESGVISNGQYSTGIGGGICQGSTTLHNAVVLSGLKVVERRSHSLPSKYVDKGMDAMVTGKLDYGFKNTSKYPVKIRAYVANGEAVVRLESTGDITDGYEFVPKVEISSNGLKATTTIFKVKDGKAQPHQTFYSVYRSA